MQHSTEKKKPFGANRLAVALGVVAVLFMGGVSFALLLQLGTSDKSLQKRYMAAKYQTSSAKELEKKVAELRPYQSKGFAKLTDLDMPDVKKVEATIDTVDLFERTFSKDELCLTQAVYFEARGEPLIGQVAIAEVVMNRVADPKYPDNACKVVFQNQHMHNRCQFSFACDGKPDRPQDLRAWERSLKVVALVMAGERSGVAQRATHYHASYVSPDWRLRLDKVGQVGRHIFYRDGVI